DVLEQAIRLLKAYYTDKFVQWKNHCVPRVLPFSLHDANPIGIILLAKVVEEPSMLPVAFYLCATLRPKILDGWKRHDGKTVYLSREDAEAAVAGYGALSRDYGSMFDPIFAVLVAWACKLRGPGGCKEGMERLRDRLKESLASRSPVMLDSCDMYLASAALPVSPTLPPVLCGACKDELIRRDKVERRKVWCALPAMFALSVQGWESV
ncbi:hypothetical protein BD310DRAFT_1029453, partial [Dichomitus squalens]